MKIFLLTHLYPHLRSFVFKALPFFFSSSAQMSSLPFLLLLYKREIKSFLLSTLTGTVSNL